MTDDDVVRALKRHRPIEASDLLRQRVLGAVLTKYQAPPTPRWIWLPAAAGVAMAIGFGVSASRTYQALSADNPQAVRAAEASSDAAAIQLLVGDDSAARTAAVRLLGTVEAREAELARPRRLGAGAR